MSTLQITYHTPYIICMLKIYTLRAQAYLYMHGRLSSTPAFSWIHVLIHQSSLHAGLKLHPAYTGSHSLQMVAIWHSHISAVAPRMNAGKC